MESAWRVGTVRWSLLLLPPLSLVAWPVYPAWGVGPRGAERYSGIVRPRRGIRNDSTNVASNTTSKFVFFEFRRILMTHQTSLMFKLFSTNTPTLSHITFSYNMLHAGAIGGVPWGRV